MKKSISPESACVPIEIADKKRYLDVLSKLKPLTDRIIIVQIDGFIDNDPIVNTASKLLRLEKKNNVKSWYGTQALGNRNAVMYTFNTCRESKNEFFSIISAFDVFWEDLESVFGECDYEARFDDIAFLGLDGELLFYSTTHESEFYLNRKLI